MAIIGGGPAGLLLSHILHLNKIDSIIVERQSKNYVLGRIRAGVLEAGTVQLLRDVGLGDRMDKEGMPHDGTSITWEGKPSLFIDVKKYTGKTFMAYGQTSITEDLFQQRERDNGHIICEASEVKVNKINSIHPEVTFIQDGKPQKITCDYVAGCDGFHGVSRHIIPESRQRSFQRNYPFGWLGIMAEVPPYKDVLYGYHSEGFALASQRNPMLSRFYIQVDIKDKIEDWSDDRFWEALIRRLPNEVTNTIKTGPSIEKSISTIPNSVDIKLINTGYTVGKIIEYMLHKNNYQGEKEKNLTYVGFRKNHPHDEDSVIRMGMIERDGNDGYNEVVVSNMRFACNNAIEILTNIMTEFS